ncbi:hypothetical protein PENTCL1PPCAC_3910, partial [Pristionchus entomophagus]
SLAAPRSNSIALAGVSAFGLAALAYYGKQLSKEEINVLEDYHVSGLRARPDDVGVRMHHGRRGSGRGTHEIHHFSKLEGRFCDAGIPHCGPTPHRNDL